MSDYYDSTAYDVRGSHGVGTAYERISAAFDAVKPPRSLGSLKERKFKEMQGLLLMAEQIERQLTKVTLQYEKLSSFPVEDPYENGTTLEFTRNFPNGEKTYDYAARKANDVWYVTGPRSPNGVTWGEFINWLGLGLVGELVVAQRPVAKQTPRKRSSRARQSDELLG